jgi:indole-3-glycerol phosphate synthase
MNILSEIAEYKKEEVRQLKKKFTLNSFMDMDFFESKSFSLSDALRNNRNISIIAEIKKASPSKGIIKKDFNHLKIAETYFSAGAEAVSVLTDKAYFHGDLNFLREIASIKQAPLLRKDFIIDEYQVFESKANGADIILLICEILSESQIKELTAAAKETGLEVLLELHSESQFSKLDYQLNELIGINNRNLEDFSVNLDTTLKLSEKLPVNILVISESGISKKEDIDLLKQYRVNGILVGEHLMTSGNISEALKQFKEWCEQ